MTKEKSEQRRCSDCEYSSKNHRGVMACVPPLPDWVVDLIPDKRKGVCGALYHTVVDSDAEDCEAFVAGEPKQIG